MSNRKLGNLYIGADGYEGFVMAHVSIEDAERIKEAFRLAGRLANFERDDDDDFILDVCGGC